MAKIDDIGIEMTILIGQAEMPLADVLKLGRGAVIPLGRDASEPLDILANNHRIATGNVRLDGENVKVEVERRIIDG